MILDSVSFENALKLNRSCIRGRKLNIRPTRSKQELADIVSKTKEMVQEKIRNQKSGDGEDANDEKVKSLRDQKKKQKKQEKKAKKKLNKAKHKTPNDRKDENSNKKKDPNRKLTKQERNRKAAIILSLRRKGKK